MEATTLNPDQTAPLGEQSDLGTQCLQYRLPEKISRRESKGHEIECRNYRCLASSTGVAAFPLFYSLLVGDIIKIQCIK